MNFFAINSSRVAFLVVMTLWLCGCNSLDHAARNGPIPKGKSIVFGSILVKSSVSGWFESGNVTVINTRNSEPVLEHPVKGLGGPFYWSLPPGQYAILDLCVHRSIGDERTSSRRIFAEFSIDSEQTAVYVGTLGLASSLPSVTDDFDTAVKTFHSQFPTLNTEPIKQLLHFEKRK